MANIPISSFTAAANATGIGMSGFSLTGTNAQSMLDLAGTWNTSGTPTGIKINVTDTASNAASLLADLQVGGTSRFNVTKAGGGYFAGNVGIGTTNANSRLVVSDSAAIASLRVDTSNAGVSPSNYSEIVLSDINSPRAWWRNVRDGSGQTGFGYNNHLAFFSAAGSTPVERVRFDNSGNVGIGTNSPGTPLDVNGTARAGNFRVNAGGSVTGAGIWGIDTILAFNTGSTERMRIDSAGNLGVGTATPTLLFQVGARGGMSAAGVFQWGSALTGNNRGVLSWDTNLATIGSPQNLVFCTNTESTERMRIDINGNVGVGTNAPTAKLHVEGGSYTALRLASNTGISAELYGRPGVGDDSAQIQFFTSAGVLSSIFGSIGGSLRFFTNGSNERMRILSGGELCVGRTNALNNGTLSVLGTATQAITTQVTVDGNSLIQGYNSSAGLAFQVIGTGQGYFAGNLGIGTTSPAARIHTNGGASGINSVFESNTSADTRIEFRNNATRAGYLYWDANEVRLLADPTRAITSYTNGVERMRVKNTGQVRFVPLASAPAGAEAGDVYYDSGTNKLRCYNGTIWNDLF